MGNKKKKKKDKVENIEKKEIKVSWILFFSLVSSIVASTFYISKTYFQIQNDIANLKDQVKENKKIKYKPIEDTNKSDLVLFKNDSIRIESCQELKIVLQELNQINDKICD